MDCKTMMLQFLAETVRQVKASEYVTLHGDYDVYRAKEHARQAGATEVEINEVIEKTFKEAA